MKNIFIAILLMAGLSIPGFCREEGFVKTDDGAIHYFTFGSGEPVLIINGGPGLDCDGFVPLAELLSDKYMTILFDQRGTGKSKLNKVDSITVTMDLMIEDMEALRNHLKLDKWIVLGHSFGGFLAEYYAVKYPVSIKAMILSSTGGIDMSLLKYFSANLNMRLSQDERDSLRYWSDRINNGDTTARAKLNRGRFLAPAYLYDKQYVPKLAKRLAFGGNMQINGLVFKDMYKIKFDCRDKLKNFAKPVLIIQGRQDIVGDGVAYEAHSALSNSKLIFINQACHYSWWEQSGEYKSEVEKFITAL